MWNIFREFHGSYSEPREPRGSNRVGLGRVRSGRVASGRVGSGHAGSGRVGPGRVGRGPITSRWVGPGRVGSDRVGSGRVGSGRVGSGRVGSGRVGSGRATPTTSCCGCGVFVGVQKAAAGAARCWAAAAVAREPFVGSATAAAETTSPAPRPVLVAQRWLSASSCLCLPSVSSR